jgi:hypothetical protein
MNQSFTHNKSSHGRFRGASKTSKNSRLCEPRGTFTAHGFEGAAKPFVQVFKIRLCLPSQVRLCRWESPSSALSDFADRAWPNFRCWSLVGLKLQDDFRFPSCWVVVPCSQHVCLESSRTAEPGQRECLQIWERNMLGAWEDIAPGTIRSRPPTPAVEPLQKPQSCMLWARSTRRPR